MVIREGTKEKESNWKGSKVSLFADRILYIENPNDATRKLVQLISEFSRVAKLILISLVAQLVKESACNARDAGSIRGSGRSWRRNGNPLQYSRLENSMDRGD